MAKPILRMSGTGANPQSIYDASTTQHFPLGTPGFLDDGRVFYYASYTASTALTPGNLMVVATAVANHVSVAYASGGTAGSDTVTVTLGATAATANQYRNGYITHIDGTNPGQMRKIKSHPAADSAATLELTTYDPWTNDLDGELTLKVNPYSAIIRSPGNAAAAPVGVNLCDLADSSSTTSYFWVQTWGPCGVIGDGSTFADGARVMAATAGTADAGQITLVDQTGAQATDFAAPPIGIVIEASDAASDGDGRIVHLQITP